MPWKKKQDGTLDISTTGDPVWIRDDNTEQPVPSISQLNNEAKGFRERAEAAEATAAAFKGLDPVKAREALDKMKDIDIGKLIDAGKLDAAKAEVAQQFQGVIAEKDKAIDTLKTTNKKNMIDMQFAASPFVREKIAVPLDMFQSSFSQHFDIDDKGQFIAKDATGNVIYSKVKSGPADFNEAIEMLVGQHPDAKRILAAPNNSGSGNNGRGGQMSGNVREVPRSAYDTAPAAEKAAMGQAMTKGELKLV